MFNKPIFLLVLADIVGIIGIALASWCLWLVAQNSSWSQVREIKVYNFNQYMEDLKLEAILSQAVRQGYFAVSAKNLSLRLREVNFVRGARVIRSWPLRLEVFLEEQKPIAYYKLGEQNKVLLNSHGEIFVSSRPFDDVLPLVETIATEDELLNLQHQKMLVNLLNDWQKSFAEKNIIWQIKHLWLTNSLSIKLHLEKGERSIIAAFGQDSDKKLIAKRFNRLLYALPKIENDFHNSAKLLLDLRYEDAIAVAGDNKYVGNNDSNIERFSSLEDIINSRINSN